MKRQNKLIRFTSIADVHQAFGLPKPQNPLVSLTRFDKDNPFNPDKAPIYDVLDFYKITFITESSGRLEYGQDYYDFKEGSMMFMAPNQLVGATEYTDVASSYVMLIHPDFLLGYPLAKKIKQYGYFSYSVNEALHLSDNEKEVILSVYRIIEKELHSRIDEFSQDVVIAQVELLLSYANRFYKRQFITRKAVNNDLLQKMEALLDEYFNSRQSLRRGIPTVHYLSAQLHVSPGYLSDVLRSLIGQSAQQLIHTKLIDKAKEKLSTTPLAVSEIAYELGFEHPQSFSKLFRQKTRQSPLEFRAGFDRHR
ncbi:helix-turn-helix transcriptional regulator [Parapedobacter sp. ISTM3]|uniref:helix-turn-helix domain-containing protein n=1 Tax=Parapedobacter sp. ISTM3 TaxID=2800130 RepID=UPI001907300F|nr:helix-turn-helix transcriptional regulator [Parapedobacter sp. ISTM3]MBK1438450.1 helix-turn-helix transcriptional regulator [Parapedobacter sp. ISTM3]